MLKAIATVQMEDVGHFITGVTFRVNFKSAHLGQALYRGETKLLSILSTVTPLFFDKRNQRMAMRFR